MEESNLKVGIIGGSPRPSAEEIFNIASKAAGSVDPKEWEGISDEEKAAKLAKLIETVDQMNREMLKDNKLGLFLYKLNYAVMRTGKPVPRLVCEQAGVDKKTLKKLARKGFIKETMVRDSRTGSLIAAYVVTENITFNANGDHFTAVEVVPADDAFEAIEEAAVEQALKDEE